MEWNRLALWCVLLGPLFRELQPLKWTHAQVLSYLCQCEEERTSMCACVHFCWKSQNFYRMHTGSTLRVVDSAIEHFEHCRTSVEDGPKPVRRSTSTGDDSVLIVLCIFEIIVCLGNFERCRSMMQSQVYFPTFTICAVRKPDFDVALWQ